jgi:hypothetical protein
VLTLKGHAEGMRDRAEGMLKDPARGLVEMARVTRAGGVVAACVWDHAGGQSPLAPFWEAVH